ncbi:MAG: flagellar export protein FliJ [Lachnospiraceae bacterium]|nr:flagellar export protein FliJ [Lachnospiraceae bacterium]
MARFVFRLQSVLNLKSRLEEQQRNAFAAARRQVDEEEEKLNNLYGRLRFYEEAGRDMLKDALFIRDIIENERAISTVKDYIEDQKLAVKRAEERLEAERVKLVEAMKDRKTYERLREKAFDDYLEEEKREEGIINDEHNSYVYGMMKED